MIYLFVCLLALLSVLAQVNLPFAYLPFDLPLLTCILLGLRRGRGAGLLSGLLAGLLLDALLFERFGPRSVALLLSGALADWLESGVNREQPRLQIALAAGISLFHDLLMAWVARAQGLSQGGWDRFVGEYLLPRAGVHALLAVPFYFLLGLLVRARVFQDPLSRSPRMIRKWPG